MNSSMPEKSPRSDRADLFATTSWTVVLAAQQDSDEALAALERLCREYRFPVYAYVRHRGYSPADAEDLTQGFFHFLLHTKRLQVADRSKGRFRAFLLAVLKGFLINHWESIRAAKRGGGKQILSLSDNATELRFAREMVSPDSPELDYERCWAREVLQQALSRVETECVGSGKGHAFEILKPFLVDLAEGTDYETAAQTLGLTKNGVAVAVHRLRQSYRNHLRAVVAATVAAPDEVEEEMRHLFSVLAR